MNPRPVNEDTILQIVNKDDFIKLLKEKTISLYLFTHNKNKIEVEEKLLTNSIVLFWLNQYIFCNETGEIFLYSSDYDILTKRLYIEYCESVLNRLVDNGKMILMWDSKKKIVYWKKNKV